MRADNRTMQSENHIPTEPPISAERSGCLQTTRRVALVTVGLCFLFAYSLCAQTPDPNISWITTTIESLRSSNLNPIRMSASRTQLGNRTIDEQSLQRLGFDGTFVPYQDIEKETVEVNSGTVRTTTRTFVRNADGARTLFQVTEEEKQSFPGGNSKVVRTTSNVGADGNHRLVQRDIQDTKKTGPDAQETKTTTFLPGVDGLAPVMQTDEFRKRTGEHTVEVQKMTLLPDGTGSWQVGEVRKSTVREEDKSLASEEQISRPDSEGKLSEVSRTVLRESGLIPAEKRDTQDTYSIDTPGIAPDGKLHLVRRVTIVQRISPNGQQTTTEQVEQPNPGDPSASPQVTTSTTSVVIPGPSGAQATRTIRVRDGSGNLEVVSVDTTRTNNIRAVQAQIGLPDKSTPYDTKTSSEKK
jgi:hypothetical protein